MQAGGVYSDEAGAACPFIYDVASDGFEKITAYSSGDCVLISIDDAGAGIVFRLRRVDESHADLRSF